MEVTSCFVSDLFFFAPASLPITRPEDSSDEPEELLEDPCEELSPPRYEEIYPLSS